AHFLKQPYIVVPIRHQPTQRFDRHAVAEKAGQFPRLACDIPCKVRTEVIRPQLGGEIARLLYRAHVDLRMLAQIVIERGGPRLSRAHYEEVRQLALRHASSLTYCQYLQQVNPRYQLRVLAAVLEFRKSVLP